jgi:hypothetical protein
MVINVSISCSSMRINSDVNQWISSCKATEYYNATSNRCFDCTNGTKINFDRSSCVASCATSEYENKALNMCTRCIDSVINSLGNQCISICTSYEYEDKNSNRCISCAQDGLLINSLQNACLVLQRNMLINLLVGAWCVLTNSSIQWIHRVQILVW